MPVGSGVRRPEPSPEDPSVGGADAPVTAIIFGDHQCPYTGRALETLLALQHDYGDRQLRVVWKSLPLSFHKRARAAALAGQAVNVARGGAAFFAFSRVLLGSHGALDDISLEEAAVTVGVPRSSYRTILAEADLELGSKVDADGDTASSLGIRGVPYVFVNDRPIDGAQPSAVFAAAIEDALAAPVCAGPT